MSNYIPPIFYKHNFNCPHCNSYSHARWAQNIEDITLAKYLFIKSSTYHREQMGVFSCEQDCCKKRSYWLGYKSPFMNDSNGYKEHGIMIWPNLSTTEQAHEDMPSDIKKDYEEARQIVAISPRAAAALLRLAIEKLLQELNIDGKDIYQKTANLVKNGVPVFVQQSLDYCRVTGNNAVHPGVLNLDDTPEMVNTMFKLINIIVHSQISIPKMAEEAFQALPEKTRIAIAKRDATNLENMTFQPE